MRPIVLLAEFPGSESLKNSFEELSFDIETVYGISESQRVIEDYSDALVMFEPGSGGLDQISRMRALYKDSGNYLIVLKDKKDNGITSCFGDDVFAYLNLPLSKREIEMLVHYYEQIPLITGRGNGRSKLSGNQVDNKDPDQPGKILSESTEQYRKVFESMSMISVQGYNERREVIFWNDASEVLYGYSREEAMGRKLEDLIIHDEMKDKVIEDITNYAGLNIEIPASELVLKRKDGTSIHVFSSHAMITNIKGEKEIYSVDLDLTQIKRHQLIQEVLSDIATATNTSDDLQDFLKTLKDSLSRIINTRNFFIALYNEEDNSLTLPIFVDDVDQFRTFPAGRTLTAYMINKNQPLLLKEEEMAALEDQDMIDRVGSPCKLWLGVPLRRDEKVMGAIVLQSYTDDTIYDETDMRTLQIVSEQISVAIDRKARQEELRESERAMKTLISNLPGIAYRCKPDESFTMEFLSDGFSSLTGYDANEFIGNKRYIYSDLIHPDDRSGVWETVNRETSRNEPYYLVYRITVKGDLVKWVWEKGRGVYDDSGNLVALEGFIIDITDRIEMEEQITLAKERAEESDKLKSAFLANLSHEIRSPMNSIVGFSQLLMAEKVNDPVSQYVEIIFQSSRQLLNVINDIVDMAKVDSGQMLVRKKDFNPEVVIDSMKKYAKEQLQNYADKQVIILVSAHPAPEDVTLFSDEILVRKVMVHLINNAIKFTDRGSIEIGYDIDKDNVFRFFVRDTGIGISSMNHKLVFERFRQVDERTTRKYEGTGLGLSISKGIIGLVGGNLWVESSEGSGSEFYFTIPGK